MLTLAGKTSDEVWPQLEEVVLTNFPSVQERKETVSTRKSPTLTEKVLVRGAKVAQKTTSLESPIKLSSTLN